ncbi:uncharacterized protein LOC135961140 [Calliphora vicina]|uniref:uncharacterized protein LOC135953688 n=1 Tax=Calliphora vicina TaxID=7373 RepID=UPI00325BB1E2
MVEFMVEHPELAKGHINSPEARSKSRHLWERLTQALNSACFPTRDTNGWKKVWADYKNHIKVKCKRNKIGISGTGGGPSSYCALTPQEQEVCDLLAINVSVHGMSGRKDFGASTPTNTGPSTSLAEIIAENDNVEENVHVMDDSIETEEHNVENLNVNTSHRPRRNERLSSKESLIKKQVENQIAFQENSLKVLKDIDINQQNNNKFLEEIRLDIADIKRYSKRKCDIEERKLKLAKEKFEFKKKIELEKTKRKIVHLELKKQMFDLESAKYNKMSK